MVFRDVEEQVVVVRFVWDHEKLLGIFLERLRFFRVLILAAIGLLIPKAGTRRV